MNLELQEFEQALKNAYSDEVTCTHSEEIQNIIDRCNFNFTELCRMIKRTILIGSKNAFIKSYGGQSSWFDNTVATAETVIKCDKNLVYIYCEDIRSNPSATYIIVFPKHKEMESLKHIGRIEKLKAFL